LIFMINASCIKHMISKKAIVKQVDVVLLLKTRLCAARNCCIQYFVINEISCNGIIMLLCATKEVYLKQTTLNHY